LIGAPAPLVGRDPSSQQLLADGSHRGLCERRTTCR
jgi:hypothetical protein